MQRPCCTGYLVHLFEESHHKNERVQSLTMVDNSTILPTLVITHNSGEGIMRERKNREQGKSGQGLEESLQTPQEDVGPIAIRGAIELAPKEPHPAESQRRPRVHQVEDQLGCQQH